MTFLPIVERELRVTARRKSTRRIRVGITVAAILVVAVFLLFSPLLKAGQAGSLLFKIVTGYVFGFCVLAGVFVTSDCLSGEKREGTLGLLFLTELQAAGVVAGKFIAGSLNPFLAWLAVLPVISLAILLGGVTGAEFWRMALALLNTLFLSLATGICVSAWSRDAQRALSATLGLLLLVIASPSLWYALPWSWFQWLGRCSPLVGYLSAFDTSFTARPDVYWGSVMVIQALAILLLVVAAVKIHVAWQDDPMVGEARGMKEARRRGLRRRCAEGNPIYFLMQSSSGLRLTIWIIASLWAVAALGWQWWTGKVMDWPTVLLASKGVGFVLKVIFVTQVCRFVVEARRGGSLEALFCTPVTDAEILQAHWLHLRRLFLWPVVLFLLPAVVAILLGESMNAGGGSFWSALASPFGLSSGGFLILGTVTDFLALACVGVWFALSLRKPALAPGMTILCVLIPPLLLFFIPDIFYGIMILAWARERLERGFRKRLAEQYAEADNQRP